jgi:hypothetical protein
MSKASRLTRTIPACVTDVIERDDCPVAASSTPPALVTIRIMIAFVRIRFRKPLVKIDRNGLPRSWDNNDSAICEESQHPPFYCVTVPAPLRPSRQRAASSTPARSRSAPAIPMMRIRGSGLAVSIRDRSRASNRTAQPLPSMRPAPISSALGGCFCRGELRRISRRGAIKGIGLRENTRCGTRGSGCRPTNGNRANRAASI